MSPMAQAFLILYALFALATPILVIALYVRYSKLRAALKAAEEESARQIAAVRRDLWELKQQVASKPAVAPTHMPEMLPTPAVQRSTVAEPKTEPAPSAVPQPPAPTTAEPSAPGIAQPSSVVTPQKSEQVPPPAPVTPTAPQPVPPAQKEERQPATPPAPPKPEPHVPAPKQPPPSVPVTPSVAAKFHAPAPAPAQPKTPVEVPVAASSTAQPKPETPAASARTSAPSSYSPLRIPLPKPTLQERMNKVSAFEEALGTNWLQKLGIVLLVLGVASFGIYELAALGSFGKVLVSYLVAAALLGGGIFLEKRERYQLLGRTGIGGGWALLFFTTYALYHVNAMRVLNSLVLDSALMLIVAAAMAAHTLRYRSQLVTGLAFLLGYSTVALSQDTVYSLSAGVILAVGLVAIVLKMRWYELEVFGILSSYLNHFYWLYRILGIQGARGHLFPEYTASTAMLFFYWVVFRASYVVRKPVNDSEEHMSTAAAVLNSLLLLATLRFQSVHPELAWILLLSVGAIELALAQIVRTCREAFIVLTVMGSALVLAAAPSHYAGAGNDVAILWVVGMEVFLITGVLVKEVVFRRVGFFTGLLVALWLGYSDLRPLWTARLAHERGIVPAAVLFGVCAIAYYLNALGVGRKWSEFFSASPDDELLISHSYLGAATAALAVWAFFIKDWTALGFAVLMLTLAAVSRVTGSRLSQHLQMQYLFFGVLTAWRTFTLNLQMEYVGGPHLRRQADHRSAACWRVLWHRQAGNPAGQRRAAHCPRAFCRCGHRRIDLPDLGGSTGVVASRRLHYLRHGVSRSWARSKVSANCLAHSSDLRAGSDDCIDRRSAGLPSLAHDARARLQRTRRHCRLLLVGVARYERSGSPSPGNTRRLHLGRGSIDVVGAVRIAARALDCRCLDCVRSSVGTGCALDDVPATGVASERCRGMRRFAYDRR